MISTQPIIVSYEIIDQPIGAGFYPASRCSGLEMANPRLAHCVGLTDIYVNDPFYQFRYSLLFIVVIYCFVL